MKEQHLAFMQRALQLAQQAEGRTSPNPMVGAVIVHRGQVVGMGYHERAGEAHAEVMALQVAGEQARGATMYVTLEPCSHFGRTPPCTQVIIEAGIHTVYYAVGDPNPQVNGRGRQQLEAAGVRVFNAICKAEATALNRPFFKFIQTGLPFVTAKFGMTLDGKIATSSGDSQWITNPSSRQQGHQLRNVSDVIMVGVNTVIADNPRLTTRLADDINVHHPVRIVVDSHGRTPLDSQILNPTLAGQTVIATVEGISAEMRSTFEAQNALVWEFPADSTGRVDLCALLQKIGAQGWITVMVEGGGTLLGSLLQLRQIDRVWAFIAPKIVGGATALTPFSGDGIATLHNALTLTDLQIELLDGDIWLRAEAATLNTSTT